MRMCLCLAGLFWALLAAQPCHAALTLFVSPDGADGYIIEGDNIADAQVVEVTVDYDASALANPRVSVQGASTVDLYDGTPGTLIFTAERGADTTLPFEAHLSFARHAGVSGGINSVTGSARDAQGKRSAAGSSLNLPAPQTEGETPAGMPENAAAKGEPAAEDAGSAGSPAAAESANIPADGVGELPATARSVLQRFEEYRGKRGLGEFSALFEREGTGVVQVPRIALSDGKTVLRATLQLQVARGELPDFGLSDAELVSVQRSGEKEWEITALPNKGSSEVTLWLRKGGVLELLPLLVAAPLNLPQAVNEKNFLGALNAYLSDCRAAGGAGGNSSRTPFLEYSFTANYLANLEKSAPVSVARRENGSSQTPE